MSNMVATFSSQDVATAAEEVTFKIYVNLIHLSLNNYMYIVAAPRKQHSLQLFQACVKRT